jgi:hypothetical protein
MISAISSATAGLNASAAQFASAAQRVVKATAPAPVQKSPMQEAANAPDDLAAAIVDTKTAAFSYKADAAVFKIADKMMGTLLDTLA